MKFTILTPTFNRAHTLGRLYDSLCSQTFRDFEWLIVDDGSVDGTEMLVSSWQPFFPIRYFRQSNSGKHVAMNLGLKHARGELVFQVDSDDYCLPQSLERFEAHWRLTPRGYCGVGALCCHDDGRILGKPFPSAVQDTYSLRDVYPLRGADRCSVLNTEVWRQFPFPVFPGERFIAEGVVWNRMLSAYPCRFVNEPLKVKRYAPGGLSDSDLRPFNPRGATLYYRELAFRHRQVPAALRLKAAINAVRWSLFLVRFTALRVDKTVDSAIRSDETQ